VHPDDEREAWELTLALLDRLHRSVQRDGARLAIAREKPDPDVTDRLDGYCREREIPCLDFGPGLREAEGRGDPVHLVGDPHLAPAGQRILAAALLDFLSRERLLE
jgi:hypothetical protein